MEPEVKLDFSYDYNLVCTYQNIKDLDDSEMLYRIQFLQVFNLDNYDGLIINDTVKALCEKLADNQYIVRLFKHNNYFEDDKLCSFMVLFSYKTFYRLQKIIGAIFNNLDIDEENVNQ